MSYFRYKFRNANGVIGYTAWYSLKYTLVSDIEMLRKHFEHCLVDIEYK